jgi:hypothetical protein
MKTNKKAARLAGALYLLYLIGTILANKVLLASSSLNVDAATAARNMVASAGQLRLGIVIELVGALFFFLAAWALYVLLRPTNKNLALLFLLLNLGGAGVWCLNYVNLFAALLCASSVDYLQVFPAEQLQALAMLFLSLRDTGSWIAQLFYGAWLLPLGYLVFKSGILPRALGIVLLIHCGFWLLTFAQKLLLPGADAITSVSYPLGFIAEFALTLWLLVMGAREPQPAAVEVG